jgi:hypothetical protein
MMDELPGLIFPAHEFSIKTEKRGQLIFDRFRKRWIRLTPEEWVRQHLAMHLVNNCRVPPGLLVIEGALDYNNTKKRFDLLAYGKSGKPLLLAECKAYDIKISQDAFDQVSVYNIKLEVPYLLVTNGRELYVCKIDFQQRTYTFLDHLPAFELM